MSADEDAEEIAHRRKSDEEVSRTPAERSFHAALHGLARGRLDNEASISHDCDGSWIDDYGWDRIPAALIAAGWAPPEAASW